jgi:hypothetical protein
VVGAAARLSQYANNGVIGWLHPHTTVPPAENIDLQVCLLQHDMLVAEADKMHATIDSLTRQTATLQPLADQLPVMQAKITKRNVQAETDKTTALAMPPLKRLLRAGKPSTILRQLLRP